MPRKEATVTNIFRGDNQPQDEPFHWSYKGVDVDVVMGNCNRCKQDAIVLSIDTSSTEYAAADFCLPCLEHFLHEMRQIIRGNL